MLPSREGKPERQAAASESPTSVLPPPPVPPPLPPRFLDARPPPLGVTNRNESCPWERLRDVSMGRISSIGSLDLGLIKGGGSSGLGASCSCSAGSQSRAARSTGSFDSGTKSLEALLWWLRSRPMGSLDIQEIEELSAEAERIGIPRIRPERTLLHSTFDVLPEFSLGAAKLRALKTTPPADHSFRIARPPVTADRRDEGSTSAQPKDGETSNEEKTGVTTEDRKQPAVTSEATETAKPASETGLVALPEQPQPRPKPHPFYTTHTGNDDKEVSEGYTIVPKEKLHKNDILLGRGRKLQKHPGNIRMRRYIDEHFDAYDAAPRQKKTLISTTFVQESIRLGYRFLKQVQEPNPTSGKLETVWALVNDVEASRKIASTFRNYRKKPYDTSVIRHPAAEQNGDLLRKRTALEMNPPAAAAAKKIKTV